MHEWPTTTVRELVRDGVIAKPVDGNHGEIHPRSSDFIEDGIPFIMASDLSYGRVDLLGCKKISVEQANGLRKGFAKEGDVLLSHKATIGRTAIVGFVETGHMVLTPQVTYYRVIDEERLDRRFLKAYFESPDFQSLFHSWAGGGSTRAYLGITGQLQFPIPVPPLAEQQAIGEVVGHLDDKIDLNRRMNETLEAMARALFKDWFVDFGPVRAKTEGRDPPEVAPEIAALFPDRLEENGLPEGWTSAPLDEIASFLNGIALQKWPADGTTFLPVIKIAQLRAGTTTGSDTASTSIPQQYVVRDGDVLFSWSGSLMHRVWTAGDGALNQHLFKVTSDTFPKWFYYHWIGLHMPAFQAVAASKATTMGHIQRHHLTQALTSVPTEAVMKAADLLIEPLFEKAIANDLESKTLGTLRDLLLPKLMSGELRVRDAEKLVERAA